MIDPKTTLRYAKALLLAHRYDSWLSHALPIHIDAMDRQRSIASDILDGFWLYVPKTQYVELVVKYGSWQDRLVSKKCQSVSLVDYPEIAALKDLDIAQILMPFGLVLKEWLATGLAMDIDGETRRIWTEGDLK